MAQPVILQSIAVASAAPAPANFTANFAGNTTAGNLLVAFVVAALSGAPTISTPANWTAVTEATGTQGTVLALRAFVLPNNAGGFTAVTFGTLTNVNGIAVGLYEVTNALESSAVTNAGWVRDSIGVLTAAGPGAITISGAPASGIGNTLLLHLAGCLTTTTINSALLDTNAATGQSVLTTDLSADSAAGATNARLQTFRFLNGPDGRMNASVRIDDDFAGGSACGGIALVIPTTDSQPRNRGVQNGRHGLMVSGYAGSTGGF